MSTLARTATASILLGIAAIGAAHAAPTSLHGHYSGHAGYSDLIRGYEPQQSMAPQFNNPGPQIKVPQTGNAVDQLSPLMGAGQPGALGIK
jgi:hypothetical protein